MFLIVFCQQLSTSSSSVSPVPLWCRADAPLTVCSRDGRGQRERERERVKEMCERKRERDCTVKQLVSDWTHSLASCMEREMERGELEGEGGWMRGESRNGGERQRARRQEKGDGRRDRVQTVACSPTNQNVDEGIWVWLWDCRGDVGQYKCTSSLTHSPYVSVIINLFFEKISQMHKRSQQSLLQW